MKRQTALILSVGLSIGRCYGAVLPPVIEPEGGEITSPVLLFIHNPNPTGAVFYTVNGEDPRDAFGNVQPHALVYRPPSGEQFDFNNPVSVNRSMLVRARVKSGTNWSALAAAAFTGDQDFSRLLFTEVMYHPTALMHTPRDEEFVELKNVGDVPLDVSGLRLVDLSEGSIGQPFVIYTFPNGSIVLPGAFVVLAFNTNSFYSLYPGVRVDGVLRFLFNNHLGRPALVTSDGALATQMRYETHAPWQVLPDNHGYFQHLNPPVGFSLVRTTLDPAADPEHFSTWRASARRLGSPGADDPDPGIPPILINELLSRSSSARSDTVELFNPTPTNVSIGGWWLSDARNEPYRYLIPPGTTVPAQGYLLLDESHFNSGTNSLSFSSDGERCYLFSGDTNGNLTGYSHGFLFNGSDRDVSFGRHQSSEGDDSFLSQRTLTFGAVNSGPGVPPLMITEIMYHPDTGGVAFVELRNTQSSPLALWEPERPESVWGIGSQFPGSEEAHGPTFLFPPNTVLEPGGFALCVAGDPETFRTAHAVPGTVPIFSVPSYLLFPVSRVTLRIYRPSGSADAGGARYLVVDEARYRDRWPWDPGAAGGGQSLERMGLALFGHDSASWRACPTGTTPGRPDTGNLPPQVWAGPSRKAFTNWNMTLNGSVFDDRWPGTTVTSWWSQIDGPANVTIENNSSPAALVRFPQTGSYVLRLTASDGLDSGSTELNVEVIPHPFEVWRSVHFSEAELGQLASGPAGDPDLDGRNNAEEFFFGTFPKLFDPQEKFHVQATDGAFEVSWTQRSDVPEEFVNLERADRMIGPWFGGPGLFEIRKEGTGQPGMLLVTVRSLATPARQQFIRLRLGW